MINASHIFMGFPLHAHITQYLKAILSTFDLVFCYLQEDLILIIIIKDQVYKGRKNFLWLHYCLLDENFFK